MAHQKLSISCVWLAGILPLYCLVALSSSTKSQQYFLPPPPQYTIPVVVHVIHTGTPIGAEDNPTDSLIMAMISLMNNAFQKNGPEYGGANVGLGFELAHWSPSGDSTTGIVRVDGSGIAHYVTGGITFDTTAAYGWPASAYEVDVKGLSRWSNTSYFNIWIVNTINGDPFFPGGYAYFPEYNSALTDGLVVRASVVNGENKTCIHEIGHYLSLLHTFGYDWYVCPEENDCQQQGDLVCDTEVCIYEFDCGVVTNQCTGEGWEIEDPSFNYTILNNYMGYTNCQWMFTSGQKDRMLDALFTYRNGLLTSSALSTMALQVPPTACVPVAENGLSPYYGIERITIGNLQLYSNTSAADGSFYIDRSMLQQVRLTAGDSASIEVKGSYQNYQQIRAYLDFNGNGQFDLPGEEILHADGGIVQHEFLIPHAGIKICTPLRLRVVSELPGAPEPDPCLLIGNANDGVGQIEDISVIVQPRTVVSVGSGNWTTVSTWACNCIPGEGDYLRIMAGDSVYVPGIPDTVFCGGVWLEPGAILKNDGKMKIAGGCQ